MALTKVIGEGVGANVVTTAKLFSTFENGMEFYETYRLAANTSAAASNDFTTTFSLAAAQSYGSLTPSGTSMSYSSGVWTFPATGMYLVHAHFRCFGNTILDYMEVFGKLTTNNSSYVEIMNAIMGWGSKNATTYQSCDQIVIVDITNTTTHKMKFTWAGSHSVAFNGGNASNVSNVTFMRIGDT